MQTFAAIDIGSNSCRLKIARVQQHRLRLLHEDREVTRLGSSVFASGLISPDSMAATLRALKRFYRAVKMHGADQVRAVGTASLREARNAQAFLAWVKSETGWNVEIISGLEEARLIQQAAPLRPRLVHDPALNQASLFQAGDDLNIPPGLRLDPGKKGLRVARLAQAPRCPPLAPGPRRGP